MAQAERRNTRRLVRYWVFLVIAYGFGLLAYFYFSALHAFLSSFSASAGMVGPRYLIGAIGLYYLTGFVLGIVFLGFDIRARDQRDGIVEVLDSRPLTNLELVGGRFLALFLSAWIPIVVLVLLLQGFGLVLPLLGSPLGRTVEPLSLFAFVFYLAVPAIVFAIGLVFVVTLLVRHRLIAAVVTVAAIVGLYWLLFTVPGQYLPYFDYLGVAQQEFPSDIVPGIAVEGGFVQRFGVLALGLGLVGFAAVLHPRLDGRSRLRPALGSAALAVVGLLGIQSVAQLRVAEVEALQRWRDAHAALAQAPRADLVAIDGSVAIEPGRGMAVDLVLELQAPSEGGLSRVILTLNPGFELTGLSALDGRHLESTLADGLLDILLDRALAPGERLSLNLGYSGMPDQGFGYLDSVLVPETLTMTEAQAAVLGYRKGLFDARYVALTPGIRWLPATGSEVGRDDPRQRPVDFFDLSLEVTLPADWLAAGTDLRQSLESSDERARFRFAPQVPIPEFALMAAEFERFATEIRGIQFEVLVHPEHDANFTVLADARSEVEQWIEARLDVAAAAGLKYPFGAFTVVEVPNSLRGFEGGWRLDSALAPPGMMLLRETSFPTARFDVDAVAIFGNRDYDQDGGAARIDRNRLINFFNNDFSGGNVFAGAARSFFAHRTAAYGPNAITLDYLLEELSTLAVSGNRSYFSAHLFTNINQAVVSIINSIQGQSASSVADAVINARTARTEVWNTVLEAPLADMDPWDDPERAIDMLALKGGELAEAVRDTLGIDAVVELLALLLERHAGATYTLDDFMAAAESVSGDLGLLVEDWINGTGLPGFEVRGLEQYRLADDENGDARYQLLVRLSNNEPVVGFARMSWTVAGSGPTGSSVSVAVGSGGVTAVVNAARSETSDPIRIPGRSAIELGAVLRQPVLQVAIEPYLSLNRRAFMAGELPTSSIPSREAEPFEGVRAIPFDFPPGERIIADDLDAAFAIVTEDAGDSLRLAARGVNRDDLDQGLPIGVGNFVSEWSRRELQAAWGRYRHTLAYVRAGDGLTRAVLAAELPAAGPWELELHVPPMVSPTVLGSWELTIVSAAGREPVSFDASVSAPGWHLVGAYELPAGEVRVEFSDRTDGRLVIADAVAWTPVGRQTQAQARAQAQDTR